MKKQILFAFIFLFFACVYAGAEGLSISPTRIEMPIERNTVAEGSFSVTNNYNGVAEIDITASDWNTYKGNGNPDINSWLKISQPHISLQQGETKKVSFTVQTSSAMAGSVSAQVTFTMRPPGNEGVIVKMSCPVYLTIKGTEKVDFAFSNFAVYGGGNSDIKVQMRFKNNGNVHVRPSGKMNVYDGKKKLVYTCDIPESYPVYAGTPNSSAFEVPIPKSLNLAPDLYTAKIIMSARNKTIKKKIKFSITDNSVIFLAK